MKCEFCGKEVPEPGCSAVAYVKTKYADGPCCLACLKLRKKEVYRIEPVSRTVKEID